MPEGQDPSHQRQLIDKWLHNPSTTYFLARHGQLVVAALDWSKESFHDFKNFEVQAEVRRNTAMRAAFDSTQLCIGSERLVLTQQYPWLAPRGLISATALLVNWPLLLPLDDVLSAFKQCSSLLPFEHPFLLTRVVTSRFPRFQPSTSDDELKALVTYFKKTLPTPFTLFGQLFQAARKGALDCSGDVVAELSKNQEWRASVVKKHKLWNGVPLIDSSHPTLVDLMEASNFFGSSSAMRRVTHLSYPDREVGGDELGEPGPPSKTTTSSTDGSGGSIFTPSTRSSSVFRAPRSSRSSLDTVDTPRSSGSWTVSKPERRKLQKRRVGMTE
ncbi:hypothetical protein JCM10213v2_002744 [Rhodosporidiobolus nylandii]